MSDFFGVNETIVGFYQASPKLYQVKKAGTVAIMRDVNGRIVSNGTLPEGAYIGLLNNASMPIMYRSITENCELGIVTGSTSDIEKQVAIVHLIPGFASVPCSIIRDLIGRRDIFVVEDKNARQNIMEHDTASDFFCFLTKGTARVEINGTVVAEYQPVVSVFGEASLLRNELVRRTATVTAATDCSYIKIFVGPLYNALNATEEGLREFKKIRDYLLEGWNMSQFNNSAHLGKILLTVEQRVDQPAQQPAQQPVQQAARFGRRRRRPRMLEN